MHKVAKSQEIQGFEKIKGDKNTMIKVLFLCHGNICRSTMAQFVFQDMVNKRGWKDLFYIDSAATSREEIGNPPHYGTVNKLRQMKIPVLMHHAVQLKKEDYVKYDYIIGMDDWNIRNIMRIIESDPKEKVYKLLHFAEKSDDIADPWYTGNFDETYHDIVEGCNGFIKYLIQTKKYN